MSNLQNSFFSGSSHQSCDELDDQSDELTATNVSG